MSETNRSLEESTLFRQKLELLLLTGDEAVLSHVREIISLHQLTFRHFNETELTFPTQSTELRRPSVVFISQKENESLQDLSGRVDQLLKELPKSSIITLLHDSSLKENLEGTENPRVFPLSQQEFFKTIKFESIVLAKSRSQFFTIQTSDLFPMTSIDFTAFVQLTLNQRYLAVLFKKLVLTEERLQRISRAPGLLIPITESQEYHKYITTYYDKSGASLKKRARSLFYSLTSSWLTLLEYLILDYKTFPADEVKNCFENVRAAAKEIVELLQTEENLWETFNEASQNHIFKLWREPWIAIYATIISVKSGQGNPEETLIGGLFSSIGMSDLPQETFRKYIASGDRDFTEEEKKSFENVPMASLNRSLAKNLPLTENEKSILVTTQERFDGKGFPNQVPAEKIPAEASLIRFATLIDRGARTTMEETNVGFRFLREKIWEAENQNTGNFDPALLEKIANALL